MYKSYLRYFVGFFVTIVLIIILIILLFGGGNKSDNNSNQSSNSDQPTSLTDIMNPDSAVRMTIAGNVRANQQYYEIQVTSSSDQNSLQIIQGYENNVIETKTFSNNMSAYQTFLLALQNAGYMSGDDNTQLADDRGYCPLGQRFIFEIIESGKVVQRYWSSTCGKPKTYLGNTALTTQLFQMQIPEYSNLTNSVDF